MRRPECGSCPYWIPEEEPDEANVRAGSCVRFPPQIPSTKTQQIISTQQWDSDFFGWHPETLEITTCGEHPDFPTYAKWFKEHPEERDT